ncbi:MAG: PEP-CTERM sorting domain-containing protein [Kiritimatiellia bacterium]
MKKILMALFALAVATTVATAGIGISWGTTEWGENHLGDGSGSGNSILSANDVLWQLIYAGVDNTIDPIHDDGVVAPMEQAAWAANDYLRPGGDDQLIAERVIPMGGGAAADGTVWDEWLILQSGSTVFVDITWAQAGFAYQRVFESATPLAGSTFFYETDLFALDISYPQSPPSPQVFNVGPSGAGFVPDTQAYAVPEPATMGLLGLGALVMAIRRRRS